MGENGWLTRHCYCTPLEVQRTPDCVSKMKNQVRTNRLCLLVYVPAGTYCCTAAVYYCSAYWSECLAVGWAGRLAVGLLGGWVSVVACVGV